MRLNCTCGHQRSMHLHDRDRCVTLGCECRQYVADAPQLTIAQALQRTKAEGWDMVRLVDFVRLMPDVGAMLGCFAVAGNVPARAIVYEAATLAQSMGEQRAATMLWHYAMLREDEHDKREQNKQRAIASAQLLTAREG
jgi:hypothetical protein